MYKDAQNTTEQAPKVAVDSVIFSIQDRTLRVLLIKIKDGPYANKWCLPGGLVGNTESLEDAVKRILFQKANISGIYLEQLYTFGEPNRDSRGRSVSVAYYALINDPKAFNIQTTEYYDNIEWIDISKLPELAFDHKEILKVAHERLKAKIGYSNIVYSLLPKDFTLTELQRVYEIILQEKLDKRNFRKKMLSMEIVEKSNKQTTGQPFRPAQLFHFTQRKLMFI